jgi:hypothetical protein
MGTVYDRIIETRYAAEIKQYERDLKAYERALKRGKKEVTVDLHKEFMRTGDFGGYQIERGRVGYQVVKTVDGVKKIELVERPNKPQPPVWLYSPYDRSRGFTSKAHQVGFLANPAINRDISPRRAEEYGEAMEAGQWRDLLSDPITITEDGHVVNGQHRLAAIAGVDWSKAGNDPKFLVVIGVGPEEAILADTSTKRTARDQSAISAKVLAGMVAA